MAITAYVGKPRSGKSYGVVANVILPALKQKRTVYTNIPMVTAELEKSGYAENLHQFEIEDIQKDPDWFGKLPKGTVLVADELWELWPSGLRTNNIPVQHKAFLAKHGHIVDDKGNTNEVVLITQDLSQCAAFLRALVDTTYRAVKLDKVGMKGSYRIDIYSGAVTGDRPPKSQYIRQTGGKYSDKVWKYYRSHTLSEGVAGLEHRTDDRANMFKSKVWFIVPAIMIVGGYFALSAVASFFTGPEEETAEPVEIIQEEKQQIQFAEPYGPPEPPPLSKPKYSKTWRLVGTIEHPEGKYAVFQWDKGDRIELLEVCQMKAKQWRCELDGEIVTRWTGRPKNRSILGFSAAAYNPEESN